MKKMHILMIIGGLYGSSIFGSSGDIHADEDSSFSSSEATASRSGELTGSQQDSISDAQAIQVYLKNETDQDLGIEMSGKDDQLLITEISASNDQPEKVLIEGLTKSSGFMHYYPIVLEASSETERTLVDESARNAITSGYSFESKKNELGGYVSWGEITRKLPRGVENVLIKIKRDDRTVKTSSKMQRLLSRFTGYKGQDYYRTFPVYTKEITEYKHSD